MRKPLTREALIEGVQGAALDGDEPVNSVTANLIVDTVLRLVADDLDRKADSDHDMNCSCEKCIEQTGVLIAAHRVRSLGETGDQE